MNISDQLIEDNIGLVNYVIQKKFRKVLGTPEYDDFFQQGCIGLMKALTRFNKSYNTKFSTYAVPLIWGEIQKYERDGSKLIHVSRSAVELYSKYCKLDEQGYTFQEICELLNVAPFELNEVVCGMCGYVTFETKINDTDNLILEDILSDGDIETEFIQDYEVKEKLELTKTLLNDKQKRVFELALLGKNQREIAKVIGTTQSQVSRYLQKAKEKYKEASYYYENNLDIRKRERKKYERVV